MSRRGFRSLSEHIPNQWYDSKRHHTYGGNHDNGIERGDDHVSVVGVRPWLQNRPDVDWMTRHDKSWTIPPPETGRHFDPHHRIQKPGYYADNSKERGYTQK